MRSGLMFAAALLCLLTSFPVQVRAQFKEPTNQDLQMTADTKWPGADAIALNVEETTDDVKHVKVYYRRFKILTEKGKERATVRMMYARGESVLAGVEGRTIHPDGTIVPLTEPPSELIEVKIKRLEIVSIVFALPSVTVGSILEFRVRFALPKKLNSEPIWELQHEYPVRKAIYNFVARKLDDTGGYRLQYDGRIPRSADVKGDLKTSFLLELADIPPLPHEEWMAPVNNTSWRVRFYYSDGVGQRNTWDHVREAWAQYVKAVVEPTKEITQIASGLVATSDSEEEKVRKLYSAVQKLDNTDFSRIRPESERKVSKQRAPKTLADIWNQKSGSADQLTLLFVSLARAAGLDVFAAQIVNRDRALFDYEYPSDDQLDDFIAIAWINGREVHLEPGEKLCPFGMLRWNHTDATGFRLTNGTPINFTTPKASYKETVVQRTANLTVIEDGSVKGSIRIAMTGSEALEWRQTALQTDLEELKKRFNESVEEALPEGIHSEVDHFLGLDDPDSNLIAQVNISGTLAAITGKRLILPVVIYDSWRKHGFVSQESRATTVDIKYPRAEVDIVYFRLPRGFAVETTPQAFDALWQPFASLRILHSTTGGLTTVQRSLIFTFTMLPPHQYAELHDFFRKVAAAGKQQFVVTRTDKRERGPDTGTAAAQE